MVLARDVTTLAMLCGGSATLWVVDLAIFSYSWSLALRGGVLVRDARCLDEKHNSPIGKRMLDIKKISLSEDHQGSTEMHLIIFSG